MKKKEDINTASIRMFLTDVKTIGQLNHGEIYELTYSNWDDILQTKVTARSNAEIKAEIIVEVQCL